MICRGNSKLCAVGSKGEVHLLRPRLPRSAKLTHCKCQGIDVLAPRQVGSRHNSMKWLQWCLYLFHCAKCGSYGARFQRRLA